jgi:hypothetical protein
MNNLLGHPMARQVWIIVSLQEVNTGHADSLH